MFEKNKNKQKEAGVGPFLKKHIFVLFAVALFQKDAVYKLDGPGNFLSDVNNWPSKLKQMGGHSTAYWPNTPTKLDKEVRTCTTAIPRLSAPSRHLLGKISTMGTFFSTRHL